MRNKQHIAKRLFLIVCALVLSMSSASLTVPAVAGGVQNKATEKKLSPDEKQMLNAFNRHLKDYLKQRDRVRKQLPALSKDSTPQQIETYQTSFVEALSSMRAGTKQGYIFRPEFTEYVRTLIKTEFQPQDKAEIKQSILEADTKGVPLKVNYPYPETKELAQVPPTLLLKLPQLPKEVKYRFVGRHMLLVDSDNNLIVDYTLNVLP